MGTINDLGKFTSATSLGAHPTTYTWETADGDTTWPTPVRAMRANDSGAIQYTDANGATITEDFLAGETRYLAAQGVVAAGTTVTKISGMP